MLEMAAVWAAALLMAAMASTVLGWVVWCGGVVLRVGAWIVGRMRSGSPTSSLPR